MKLRGSATTEPENVKIHWKNPASEPEISWNLTLPLGRDFELCRFGLQTYRIDTGQKKYEGELPEPLQKNIQNRFEFRDSELWSKKNIEKSHICPKFWIGQLARPDPVLLYSL